MVHHTIPHMLFSYPVGARIGANEKVFSSMCEQFISIANEDIISHKRVYLICSGSSGAIIATMMYFHLMNSYAHLDGSVFIIHVKKAEEDSHSSCCDGLPWAYNAENLHVWVDDHINNGATIGYCWSESRNRVDTNFLFDWAVCLTSDYSSNMESQLELFSRYTRNMVCNIEEFCNKGIFGMF